MKRTVMLARLPLRSALTISDLSIPTKRDSSRLPAFSRSSIALAKP